MQNDLKTADYQASTINIAYRFLAVMAPSWFRVVYKVVLNVPQIPSINPHHGDGWNTLVELGTHNVV